MASAGRKAVAQALLALLVAPGAFKTSGRRVLPWTKVADQPALFLIRRQDRVTHTGQIRGAPSKTVFAFEALVYSRTTDPSPDVAPGDALDDLVDGVEQSLSMAPGLPQTLGGLVQHAWIEGDIEYHPGDTGQQAIAIIPIMVLVP